MRRASCHSIFGILNEVTTPSVSQWRGRSCLHGCVGEADEVFRRPVDLAGAEPGTGCASRHRCRYADRARNKESDEQHAQRRGKHAEGQPDLPIPHPGHHEIYVTVIDSAPSVCEDYAWSRNFSITPSHSSRASVPIPCPASISTSSAPGIPAASSREWAGGASPSRVVATTRVGTEIPASSARVDVRHQAHVFGTALRDEPGESLDGGFELRGRQRVQMLLAGGGESEEFRQQLPVAAQQFAPDVDGQQQPVVRFRESGGQDEPGDPIGVPGRGADGDAGAERVAEDREAFEAGVDGDGDQFVRDGVEVQRLGAARRGPGAGVVGADDGVGAGEIVEDAPEVAFDAAATAVGEQQAGAGTADDVREMIRHAGDVRY